MVQIGRYNQLKVVKFVDFGLYLDGGSAGQILLPKRYVPEDTKVGDDLRVFIYLDSEDWLIATTETPLAMVGDFAALEVVSVTKIGAFLNWGLMKDLMIPRSEIKTDLKVGDTAVVYIYLDEKSERIAATTRLHRFLQGSRPPYQPGDQVELMYCYESELGFNFLINESFIGLVFRSEVFQTLKPGEKMTGYIKTIRPDGKIDLSLQPTGYDKVDPIRTQILDYLKAHDGFMPIHSKSSAEEIYETFGVSKKAFKMALGNLYKAREIVIEADGVRLV